MNILLLDGLPESIDGVPISPDFRNMIQFDMALHEAGASLDSGIWHGFRLLYPGMTGEVDENGNPYPSPPDIETATRGLLWFFRRGKDEDAGEDGRPQRRPPGRAYDFLQDAEMIYAAFREAYGIGLADGEFMHWWEFMALLEGLPERTRMAKAMYYRTIDTNGMDKHERKHVIEMRKVFAIKGPKVEPLTAEEMEEQTKERIRNRMEEAKRIAERRKE